VKFAARHRDADAAVVYAHVRMGSRNGRPDRNGWIAHRYGTASTARKHDEVEWALTDPGKPISNSKWRSFAWSLPEEVERTFGTEGGWFYKRLLRIRLRGPISITPIQLLE